MSIELCCPSCASPFRFPEEHAGKSARCQKCGEVFVIAVPSEEPVPTAELVAAPTAVTAEPPKASILRAEEVVDPKSTKRGSKPARLPDEDNDRRRRRDRPRKAAPSSAPWIIAGCGVLLVFFVVLVLVGGAAMFA